MAAQAGFVDGRVGGDDAVHFYGFDHMGDVVDLRLVQIRRDFNRQRHIFAMRGRQLRLLVFQGFQQCAQLVATLQGTQVFRIGGGNIDRDIARVGVGFFQANQIIVGRIFNRRNGIFYRC